VEVIEAAGILTDVNIFSVAIDANGADLAMYASVIDNMTGDPVYYSPAGTGNAKVWVPGIAHLAGANASEWRSDVTFLNDTEEPISATVTYVPEVGAGLNPGINLGIQPGHAEYYVDILGVTLMPAGPDSKGHFVITGHGSEVPNVVARTYNLAPEGGTFGQNLKVFGDADLIHEGQSGFIPGVANSPEADEGFRTNLGVLNTNTGQSTDIAITLYDIQGQVVVHLPEFSMWPGQFLQQNIFQTLGQGDVEMNGSIEIHVLSGGPVAAYASEIDNRTQDPILIPAVPMELLGR
jgi:hypothetical protein